MLRIEDKDILFSVDTYKLLRWKRPAFVLVSIDILLMLVECKQFYN